MKGSPLSDPHRTGSDVDVPKMKKRAAVIEIGSNSVCLLVAEQASGNRIVAIADEDTVTRIGERLGHGRMLSKTAMARTIAAVSRFTARARALKAGNIWVIGTGTLRHAANTGAFVSRLHKDTGCDIDIMSGEREAKLSYLSVAQELGRTNVAVVDIGGGSTELKTERGAVSLYLGCVYLTDAILRSDPVTISEFETLVKKIRCVILEAPDMTDPGMTWAGVGGAVKTMARVKHRMGPPSSGMAVLTVGDVYEQLQLYRRLSVSEREALPGMISKRGDIILAGAAVLHTLMSLYQAQVIYPSDRGARYGYLLGQPMFKEAVK